jgi:signal transduction histidine kinase
VLHDLGLAEAIEWLVRRNRERLGRCARFEPGVDWQRIPRPWHAAVFHSVSELLANAAKHAAASLVGVSAADSGDRVVCIRVLDDGRGFHPNPLTRGFGLFNVGAEHGVSGRRAERRVGAGCRHLRNLATARPRCQT